MYKLYEKSKFEVKKVQFKVKVTKIITNML